MKTDRSNPITYATALACVGMLIAPAKVAATTTDWWDGDYTLRQNVNVTVGSGVPDRGYVGYTLRASGLDTAALIAGGQLQSDCDDLRVLYFNGSSWQELARHVIGCNTSNTDVRFMSPVGFAPGTNNDNFYFYYGNSGAGAPAPLTTNNVYLWFDDASVNRASSYVRGRVDAWHGNGWDNSLAYNGAGFYTYSNGDNFTSGYRLPLDERDVYIEAEFFHQDCFPINMTTGLIVRGIIQSGSGGSESSNHYYASNRGEFPQSGCGNASGYTHDGAVMRNQRNQNAVQTVNPGDITPNQWRRQGLAAFSVGPTQLRFWDEDNAALWSAIGFPDNANLLTSGSDNQGVNSRGFAGIMTAQDQARLRNILIRRYVEPEPVATFGPQELFANPDLTVFKNVRAFSDPVNGETDPYKIPGAIVEYEIRVVNAGNGPVDVDSLVINEVLPAALELLVSDIAPGSGPIEFVDGAGATASGLTFSFVSLGSPADDVDFSQNGVDFGYTPIPDGSGIDDSVTHLRINPTGTMNAAPGGGQTEFSVVFRMRVP